MRHPDVLPDKKSIETYLLLDPNVSMIIFPDGAESYKSNVQIGMIYRSSYWGTKVVVSEMTGDRKTAWVEQVNE